MIHFSTAQATALVNSMQGQIPLPTPVDDEDIAEFITNAINQNNPAAAGISADEQETLIAYLNALPPESAAEVFDKIQFFWHYSPWQDTEFGLAQAHLIEAIDWEYRSHIAFNWTYPNGFPKAGEYLTENPNAQEWERCERLRLAQKHVPEWQAAQWMEQHYLSGKVEFRRIPHPWNLPDKETTAKQIAALHRIQAAARTAAEPSETAGEASIAPAGFRNWIATRLPPRDACIAIALDVIKAVCLVILIGIAITILYVLCLLIAQAAAEPTTLLFGTGALGISGNGTGNRRGKKKKRKPTGRTRGKWQTEVVNNPPKPTHAYRLDSIQIGAFASDDKTIDEVHLLLEAQGLSAPFVARFKNPDALAIVIEELIAYHRHVWPDADEPNFNADIIETPTAEEDD